MRPWLAPMLKIAAVALLVVMLGARAFVELFAHDYYPHDLLDSHAYGTIVLLMLVALGGLGSVFTRSNALAGVVTFAAVVAMVCVSLHAFTAGRDEAGIYPPILAALVLLVVGTAVSSPGETRPQETGELVDGKRHGQWFIYGADGVVTETRQYDRGTLVETRPYERK